MIVLGCSAPVALPEVRTRIRNRLSGRVTVPDFEAAAESIARVGSLNRTHALSDFEHPADGLFHA